MLSELGVYTIKDAEDIYLVPYWAQGFFSILASGELAVHLDGPGALGVSLAGIVRGLKAAGKPLPLILRFPGVLETRLAEVHQAFASAIEKYGYRGHYQGVYPVKVNQRRVVVETLVACGQSHAYGLEAGSKAELALILAQDLAEEALITTNGFKDEDFIRLALAGQRMGRRVIITLEKLAELPRVLRIAHEMGVKPKLGLRYKLRARGSGPWEASGGEGAKFGLSASEVLRMVETLRASNALDSLVMLHTHIGSQVTDIGRIKRAVREAAQTYVQLRKLGVPLTYLNLGGGMAVDYDGSKTSFAASANYTLQEYAEDLVYVTKEVTDGHQEPHPTLVTESGRAVTAYHSLLVLEVSDVIRPPGEEPAEVPEDAHDLVRDLHEMLEAVSVKNYRELFHDAAADKETVHTLYDLGLVSLRDRALAEELFYQIARRTMRVIRDLEYVPEEFETLPRMLADKLICNFSLFQSLPDAWAIQQLFPVVPLKRLNQRPTREATLVDISCDSDGKIDRFIDLHGVRRTLPVHAIAEGETYYLGVFLTGAYQDALGNSHNLFGRVGEAHVRLNGEGQAYVERYIPGEKARRVIERMGYEAGELTRTLTQKLEQSRSLSADEREEFLRRYQNELIGYTYLER